MVQRGNISYATQTLEGTQAWDTFMSLFPTTRKLGISFLNIFVTAFLRLGIFPVWRLFLTKNLLSILLIPHGCVNNFLPRSIQGILEFVPNYRQYSARSAARCNHSEEMEECK